MQKQTSRSCVVVAVAVRLQTGGDDKSHNNIISPLCGWDYENGINPY